jgi:ribonuclease VapC
MFVDAAAIVAILSREEEAGRCSTALVASTNPTTSAIAVWEAVVALARPQKLDAPIIKVQDLVMRFLEERGVTLVDLPEAKEAIALSLGAAQRFRSGPNRLNLADCFHYACARALSVPILTTAQEFRFTDIDVFA